MSFTNSQYQISCIQIEVNNLKHISSLLSVSYCNCSNSQVEDLQYLETKTVGCSDMILKLSELFLAEEDENISA